MDADIYEFKTPQNIGYIMCFGNKNTSCFKIKVAQTFLDKHGKEYHKRLQENKVAAKDKL